MSFRHEAARNGRGAAALAFCLALLLGACGGDDAAPSVSQNDQVASSKTQDDEPQEEQPADDDAQASGGECAVDAETVSSILDLGIEVRLQDTNETANDGLTCTYEAETDDVAVIVSVSEGSWDGSDERLESVVSSVTKAYGEPVATPEDLDGQAFVFDEDFAGTQLVVFVDGKQYAAGLSGAGFGGTRLESSEERQSIVVELYGAASA